MKKPYNYLIINIKNKYIEKKHKKRSLYRPYGRYKDLQPASSVQLRARALLSPRTRCAFYAGLAHGFTPLLPLFQPGIGAAAAV